MSIKTTDFNNYFDSIQTKPKIGELKDAPAKITSLAEYRSPKSGKTSIKLTLSVNGGEIYTYLGYSNEKSAEISKARLVKLSVAAIGYDGTKKLYEEAANDEDVSTDAELIVEISYSHPVIRVSWNLLVSQQSMNLKMKRLRNIDELLWIFIAKAVMELIAW